MKFLSVHVFRRFSSRPGLAKIVDNIAWLFFDKALRMGVGLIVGIWIARYLGPEQFGLFNFVIAFVGLFTAITGLGLQSIVVRDIINDPNVTRDTLGTAALLQVAGGSFAYLLALYLIGFLRPDDVMARALVAILGATMLFRASDIALFWFESQVQSKYTVWVQNSVFVTFSALKVVLILQAAPLVAFAWAALAEVALASILLLSVMAKHGLSPLKLSVSVQRASALLRDSWPLILSGIAVTVYMKIDLIMIGQILGNDSVGIYAAAARVSEIWYFIPIAIVASVFPSILESKKKSETQYYARLQKLYDLMVALSMAVALPMMFLSGFVINLLFGEAYSSAGAVLTVHIWAGVFVFLGVASGRWFIAEGRQLMSMHRTAIGAIVNVGLNLWLIPVYGVIGAAVATVLSYAVAAFFADAFQSATRPIFLMKCSAFNPIAVYKRFRWPRM